MDTSSPGNETGRKTSVPPRLAPMTNRPSTPRMLDKPEVLSGVDLDGFLVGIDDPVLANARGCPRIHPADRGIMPRWTLFRPRRAQVWIGRYASSARGDDP